MDFTYEGYTKLIEKIRENGYKIVSYDHCELSDHGIILRHDIDFSIEKAYRLSLVERKIGVKSTYFFLLSSDFYNVFSLKSINMIKEIAACGHDIGLHFDEVRYHCEGDLSKIVDCITAELDILSRMTGININRVSMHRPSKLVLDSDLEIPNVINTYSRYYFKDFKYVSDSRHLWKEPIESYIENRSFNKLQILIHPFWYNDKEIDIKESVKEFVNSAGKDRYFQLQENITDLESIMAYGEINI